MKGGELERGGRVLSRGRGLMLLIGVRGPMGIGMLESLASMD